MSRAGHRAAAVGLGAGAVVTGVAALLLHRTLAVVLEIDRYTGDIATAATALRRNTDLADGLGRLHATVGRIGTAVRTSATTGANP